jgi:hypothetical protein
MRRSNHRLRTAGVVAALIVAGTLGEPIAASAGTDGTVVLRTVPRTAGVSIGVGGFTVVTGADGTAAVHVANVNGVARQVSVPRQRVGERTTATLSKVQALPHTVAHQSRLAIGLNLTESVRVRVSRGTTHFAPSSVRAVRLHSIAGQVIVVDPQKTQRVSLLSRRTYLQQGVLTVRRVTWSIDRIRAGPGVALTSAEPRFDPASSPIWDVALQPMKGTVEITTVPAVEGVVFLLEGASITTGPDGKAEAPIGDLNGVDRRLQLDTPTVGSQHVSVLRVGRLAQAKVRQRRLFVALATQRDVSLRFTDAAGRSVSTSRVSAVRLEGNGRPVEVAGAHVQAPVSLLSSVATQVNSVWQPHNIIYGVSSVALDGGNAVFAGKQRFNPTSSTWTIKLAVYDVTVTTHDALFGNRISSRAEVTRPDGSTYTVSIVGGSPTVMSSMVRGLYNLKIDSAVFGSRSTMLVSRNDVLDVRVFSLLDVIVLAIVALALIAAIVLSGRYIGRHTGARRARDSR